MAGITRAEVLKQIAEQIGARSYLEVGVFRGMTFREIPIGRKVAVDLLFQFHPEDVRLSENEDFEEVGSDTYFQERCKERFDLIYLDGLHTFEQILRDFQNALLVLNEGGVIVVDDTRPNDFMAALPSEELCRSLRKQFGSSDKSWMGDVYKLVFYVHDFMPLLDYGTITDHHGQTVFWKSTRSDSKPIFDNVESIARLDYPSFASHPEAMKYESFEGIKARIK